MMMKSFGTFALILAVGLLVASGIQVSFVDRGVTAYAHEKKPPKDRPKDRRPKSAPQQPGAPDGDGEDYAYQIADRTRPGYRWKQEDRELGVVTYQNLTDCQRSARLLGARFYCVTVETSLASFALASSGPFPASRNFMSVAGYARWLHFLATGNWS